MNAESTRPLVVVAGLVVQRGRVLVARRVSGARAGRWEFPGGKVDAGESHEEALRRELVEELGLDVTVGEGLGAVRERYPDRVVELHAYRCRVTPGSIATPRAGQHDELRWLDPSALGSVDLCEADRPFAQRIAAATDGDGTGEVRDDTTI